jgi:riboflavin synthase
MMFTGIVEGRGIVIELRPEEAAIRLAIEVPAHFLDESSASAPVRLGESVAINGCCLTVVDTAANRWAFQAGSETLAKTNLGELRPGDRVNLERALPVTGRLGGHFVQGHVDGVGRVASVVHEGEWVFMEFSVAAELARLMVPKGSVAVDGVSLTIVDAGRDRFRVALIPHTLEVTTLGTRHVGDAVNIETDILGKYVQQLLNA